jgi:drug/metabolite transporter (DMT)-like permease
MRISGKVGHHRVRYHMETQFLGESAAIFVSFMWTICSILFAAAGKRLGILSLNAYRTIMALCLLGTSHLVLFGTLVPGANSMQWAVLAVSGIIGLGIGDFGYFGALVHIGPRRGLLIMSTHPIFSLIAGYFILEEVPGVRAGLGIAVTLLGVFIVILEEPAPTIGKDEGKADKADQGGHDERETLSQDAEGHGIGNRTLGVMYAFVGAAGQGLGFVLASYGMTEAGGSSSDLDPLSATVIRMFAACVFIWLVVVLSGNLGLVRSKLVERRALKLTMGGAFFGPFIGVWMSMVALSYAIAGVAATLMSLMPVIVIPVLWIVYKQRTNTRGIAGAVIAVIGVAILFLA